MQSSLESYHGKSIATASKCHSACRVQRDATHHGPSKITIKKWWAYANLKSHKPVPFSLDSSFIHVNYQIREFTDVTWFINEYCFISFWDLVTKVAFSSGN